MIVPSTVVVSSVERLRLKPPRPKSASVLPVLCAAAANVSVPLAVLCKSRLIPVVSHEFHKTGATPVLRPSAPSVTSACNACATDSKLPSIITSLVSGGRVLTQTSVVGFNATLP